MNIETDNHTTNYIASTAQEIYWRNTKIDPGAGTAESGEHYDLCRFYFKKAGMGNYQKTLQLFCIVNDWKNYQPNQDPRRFKTPVTKEDATWTMRTFFDLPELKGVWSETNISETNEEDLIRDDLSRTIRIIFDAGKNEQFEDGMRSDFSKAIERLIKNYQDNAVAALAEFLASNKIDSDLLCETLRTIGKFNDDKTALIRFQILISFLSHASPFIRDCAGLALYDIESPNAIPYIKQAVDKEPYQSLKRDFEKIIDALEELNKCQG